MNSHAAAVQTLACSLITLLLAGNAWAQLRLGSEVLADQHHAPLRGKRVGLITNQTGKNAAGRSTIDALRAASKVHLLAIFAPEHGLDGKITAGTEFTNTVHRPSGLPLYSLYGPGPTRRPTPRMLKGLDVLVYDLQDAGIRPYTFISTMGLAMDACGAAGVEFVVLDRPNPLGGVRVEGPMVEPRLRTFIGQWSIPLIYGLTCGELARMINGEGWITNRCKLTVIPMEGWRRTMTWRETRLPWIPTSPNVRTIDAALCLPTTGMIAEFGGLSIGFGTDFPFQLVGASWLDGAKLIAELNQRRIPGVQFEPYTFKPDRGAFAGNNIRGLRLRIVDPIRAPLLALNFYLLDAVRKVSGRNLFAEAQKAGRSFSMFDKINGTEATRQALERGASGAQVIAGWKPGEEAFRKRRQKYLLYP